MDMETKLAARRKEIAEVMRLQGVDAAILHTLLDIRDSNERILAKLDEVYMAVPTDSDIKKVLTDVGIGQSICPSCEEDKACENCGRGY